MYRTSGKTVLTRLGVSVLTVFAFTLVATQRAGAMTSGTVETPAIIKPEIKIKISRDSLYPGQKVRVTGSLSPKDSLSQIRLRVAHGGKLVKSQNVKVRKGKFSGNVKILSRGRYTLKAITSSTYESPAQSNTKSFSVSTPTLTVGSRGAAVKYLQSKLKAKHYWLNTTGTYDGATARAVMAFRKLTSLGREQTVNRAVWSKLGSGAGSFKLRHKRKSRYVEIDLSQQVLALAQNGKVHRILHTSSGAIGTPTILGTFSVYRHQPGKNAKGMIDSVYFIRGYAIHGFNSVPIFPASHGCLRIPPENARAVFNWLRKGDKITVYP